LAAFSREMLAKRAQMNFEQTLGIVLLILPAAFAGSLHETVAGQPGFEHFYNLEYDQAYAAFSELAAHDPSSANAYNHLAQTVLYKEMYRAGMLSSDFVGGTKFVHQPKLKLTDAEDKEFHDAIDRAMTLCQARLAANADDTAALYSIGVSYGLRANYSFVVKKAWTEALRDATAARKAHHRATELDPSLIDAKLTQGVNDYVIGSLPLRWKMLGFLGGFRGDKERGIRTLKEVGEQGQLNRVDAMVLLSALYLREKRPEEAIPVLTDLTENFPRNPLLRVELDKAIAARHTVAAAR
jgi:tetratricopeptide (TPR) repeat protein